MHLDHLLADHAAVDGGTLREVLGEVAMSNVQCPMSNLCYEIFFTYWVAPNSNKSEFYCGLKS
eukprot:SAG11_NODE_668_length_7841_cov_10.134461_10_plen_63_part_00